MLIRIWLRRYFYSLDIANPLEFVLVITNLLLSINISNGSHPASASKRDYRYEGRKCKKLLNSAAKIFANQDEYRHYLSRLHSDWDDNNCNDVYDVSINPSLAIRTPLFADYDTEFGDTKNECNQPSLSLEQMDFYFTGSLVGADVEIVFFEYVHFKMF